MMASYDLTPAPCPEAAADLNANNVSVWIGTAEWRCWWSGDWVRVLALELEAGEHEGGQGGIGGDVGEVEGGVGYP